MVVYQGGLGTTTVIAARIRAHRITVRVNASTDRYVVTGSVRSDMDADNDTMRGLTYSIMEGTWCTIEEFCLFSRRTT